MTLFNSVDIFKMHGHLISLDCFNCDMIYDKNDKQELAHHHKVKRENLTTP